MNKLTERIKNQGFTLIEVVIVLAIGALIIMVVLNAVSSAQRNQRDSARRAEASQIAAALESYSANNDGQYPANAQFTNFLTTYEPDLASKGWSDEGNFSSTCSTNADEFKVMYEPTPNQRDYRMKVCLEQGEQVLRDN